MEKLSLRELVSSYTREPTLRDVVVEGPLDKDLIDWLLTDRGVGAFTVLGNLCTSSASTA